MDVASRARVNEIESWVRDAVAGMDRCEVAAAVDFYPRLFARSCEQTNCNNSYTRVLA